MRRAVTGLLILAMSLPFALTGFVLVRFELERERIIKEQCVQRFMPETQQTCHGKCHLKRQLRTDEAPQQQAPLPRLTLRVDPAVSVHVTLACVPVPVATERSFAPEAVGGPAAGHPSIADPVPWG